MLSMLKILPASFLTKLCKKVISDASQSAKRFIRVKKVGLVALRVFSLKRSTAVAFVVLFRLLSRRKLTEDNLLF